MMRNRKAESSRPDRRSYETSLITLKSHFEGAPEASKEEDPKENTCNEMVLEFHPSFPRAITFPWLSFQYLHFLNS